jgi:hypothetical protein
MSESADSRPHPVQHSRGARPHFYSEPGLDQAMSMILVLASELSVMRDRIDAMERVATHHGIDFVTEINQLVLDQAALDAREQSRQTLLQRLYYVVRKQAHELASDDSEHRYRDVINKIAEK